MENAYHSTPNENRLAVVRNQPNAVLQSVVNRQRSDELNQKVQVDLRDPVDLRKWLAKKVARKVEPKA